MSDVHTHDLHPLAVLVPVLFVLLLGYFGGRAKAFGTEHVAGINELALDFALPASLFVGVVGISPTELLHDAPFVVAVLVTMLGLYLVALAVGLRMLRFSMSAATLCLRSGPPFTVRRFWSGYSGWTFRSKLSARDCRDRDGREPVAGGDKRRVA